MEKKHTKEALFAAGCFWGVEETFRQIPGVLDTEVGYTGGNVPSPTYEKVCGGDTGHAEAAHVSFDPSKVSYEQLLEVFWNEHDPTQVGGQGADIGEQYRSAIYYYDDEQRRTAEQSLERIQKEKYLGRKIVTEIAPAEMFTRAEEYHQRYVAKQCGGK
jgi:peptide-methionine (S)-S-oxide reductase